MLIFLIFIFLYFRGRYIEGDLAKHLKVKVKAIEFTAENLKLKPEALDELGLPVNIKKGFLNYLR